MADKKSKGSHLWKPGQSGNPRGRPKGAKSKSTLIRQAIEGRMVSRLEKDAVAILEKTIEMAKEGDTTCIKILMDRLLSIRKVSDDKERSGVGGINIVVTSNNTESNKSGVTIDGQEIEDAEYKEDD